MQSLLYANEFYISHLEVLSYLVCPSILTKHFTEFGLYHKLPEKKRSC